MFSCYSQILSNFFYLFPLYFFSWRYPFRAPKAKVRIRRLWQHFTSLYWCYKSDNLIKKAEKGSTLKAYFRGQQCLINRLLLSEGFQVDINVGISAVGDLMAANGNDNLQGKFYAIVLPLIFNADISIANLEFALTKKIGDRKAWRINATREQFDTLKGHKG